MNKFLSNVSKVVSEHIPEILTGLGITGFVCGTVYAIKVSNKAKKDIDISETRKEKVKKIAKYYAPVAAIDIVSATCIIAARRVDCRRNAVLATAYTACEAALKEYEDKVIETIGEKKSEDIRRSIVEDHMKQNPVQNTEVIVTGSGDTLCYDDYTGRYFKSSKDKLIRIENELNRRMRDEITITLNDFYYEVGLPEVERGNDFGWDIDKEYVHLAFSSHLNEEGMPCLSVSYNVIPLL